MLRKIINVVLVVFLMFFISCPSFLEKDLSSINGLVVEHTVSYDILGEHNEIELSLLKRKSVPYSTLDNTITSVIPESFNEQAFNIVLKSKSDRLKISFIGDSDDIEIVDMASGHIDWDGTKIDFVVGDKVDEFYEIDITIRSKGQNIVAMCSPKQNEFTAFSICPLGFEKTMHL